MRVEIEEVAVLDSTATNEADINNPYGLKLLEIGNPFGQISLDWFKSGGKDRVEEMKAKGVDNSILALKQLLVLMVEKESGVPFNLDEITNPPLSGARQITMVGAYSMSLQAKRTPSVYAMPEIMLRHNIQIMPYCCGITEIGNFVFYKFSKIDTDVFYNVYLDLLRLVAQKYRKDLYGARSIINYFINEPFTKVMEKRDDLRFITEFTNPKTSKTLKQFMFDTNI